MNSYVSPLPNVIDIFRSNMPKRKWTVITGPTNSGKTYNAIKAISENNGNGEIAYLAPLRLIAIEVADDLNNIGVPCNLKTGEERIVIPNARVTSSTVEMFDLSQTYDLVVVDETQLIAEEGRGWAWGHVLLGAKTEHLIVLGAPIVKDYCSWLATELGEEIEFIDLDRHCPLTVTKKHCALHNVPDQSIIVGFSRKFCIRTTELLKSHNRTVAMIYGNMPPEARRAEAERFRSGSAQILVATDAVAMGLNLPASHVFLAEETKFDGKARIQIPFQLIKQIAGRAGRRGFHTEGFVGGVNKSSHKLVHMAIKSTDGSLPKKIPTNPYTAAYLSVLEGDHTNTDLLDYGRKIKSLIKKDSRFKVDVDNEIEICNLIDKVAKGSTLAQRVEFVGAPVDFKNRSSVDNFKKFIKCIIDMKLLDIQSCSVVSKEFTESDSELFYVETYFKLTTLFLWFALKWINQVEDLDAVIESRREASEFIIKSLANDIARMCSDCGKRLEVSHNHPKCDDCFY